MKPPFGQRREAILNSKTDMLSAARLLSRQSTVHRLPRAHQSTALLFTRHFNSNVTSTSSSVAEQKPAAVPVEDALKQFFASGVLTADHWKAGYAKTGRPWDVNLLRTKSWEDLHALWIVLLKERNLLYTRLRDKKFDPEMRPSPVGSNLDKVKVSIQNLKSVIDERYGAWLRARELWQWKQRGVDIYDADVQQMIEKIRQDRRLIKVIKSKSKYIPGSKSRMMAKLNYHWPQLDKKQDIFARFHVYPEPGRYSKDRYDLDMTPIHNRRHRSRRHKGRLRIKNRAVR